MRRLAGAILYRLRCLRLRPWTLAPVRLLTTPALFITIAVTAGVLGLAAGSRPLFVSSAASAALHGGLTEGCAYHVGLRVERQAQIADNPTDSYPVPLSQASDALGDAVRDIPGLGPAVTSLYGPAITVINGDEIPGKGDAILHARTGATDYIEVLERSDTPGVWLPDTTANEIGARAGQEVQLRLRAPGETGTPPLAAVQVQGIFRDLTYTDRSPFWCSSERLFEETFPTTPPRVVLLDPALLVDVSNRLERTFVGARWEYPPDEDGWTLGRARDTTGRLQAVADRTNNRSSELGQLLGFGSAAVDAQGSLTYANVASATASASVGPVALGVAGVALLMLTIAVRAWLDRRRKELTALALRGAGSPSLATKGVLEIATPMIFGAVAGLAIGYGLVRIVGPSDIIETSALRSAALLVATGVVAALATVLVVVVPGVRHVSVDAQGVSARNRSILWEPVVLAGAAAAFYELRTHGSSVPGGTRVDALVLLFPILLLAGSAGLFARLLLRGRLLWNGARRLPLAGRLAARRIVASRARATAVVTGAAISIGLVVFAGSVHASMRSTIAAKTTLGLGSTTIVRLNAPAAVPDDPALRGISTAVTRTTETSVLVRGHASSDVLGVDPATFEDAAFWDGSFADQPLSTLLDRLTSSDTGSDVTAVAVGEGLPDRFTLTLETSGSDTEVPVRVVGRAEAFPGFGFNTSRPLVVLDKAALDNAGVVETPELWVDGDGPAIDAALRQAGLPILSINQSDPFRRQQLQPQAWALEYIQVVGFAAAAVPLCGLGFYFAALGNQRRLGAAFARKLGVSSRTGIAATVIEVGAMLSAGFLCGVAGAWVAIRLLFPYIDPLPNSPPEALFRFDRTNVALCLLGVAVVSSAATVLVERRSARSSLPELLRHAT